MRQATVKRKTTETAIEVSLDLDGTGRAEIATGVGFLDHMLDLLARHSLIDLTVRAKGDLHVDFHHTAEDVGIALGQALRQALGDKRGITRYASLDMPMDETLTRVALDISGRPYLVWFQAFAVNAGLTLHVDCLYGDNNHHIAESCFKGLARALRAAVAIDALRADAIPSTKGAL